MNNVSLTGRLTKDPVVRYTQGVESMAIANLNIAVDRKGKKDEADFVNCTAFRKQAELIEKYVKKGDMIGITGHITTGSYTNQRGERVYTTEVTVDGFDFLTPKKTSDRPAEAPKEARVEQASLDGFYDAPADFSGDGLPFN